jgi:rRNA maturation RNase YbeY
MTGRVLLKCSAGQEGEGRWLAGRAKRLLCLLGREKEQLSLVLVGDRRMTVLNGLWRGRRRVTDVLAFSQLEGKPTPGDPGLLGDVVICLPQARRQAREMGHRLRRELLILLVHGVLHLVGYEHENVSPQKARLMWREQQRLVELLAEKCG